MNACKPTDTQNKIFEVLSVSTKAAPRSGRRAIVERMAPTVIVFVRLVGILRIESRRAQVKLSARGIKEAKKAEILT